MPIHKMHSESEMLYFRANQKPFARAIRTDTHGYLQHPSLIIFGGYKVDGLCACMWLGERFELKVGDSW